MNRVRSDFKSFRNDRADNQQKFYGKSNLKRIDAYPLQESSSNSIYAENNSINKGTNVVHERFGPGIVIEVEGEGQNRKAIIDFKAAGKKNLLLKFAKLKVVKGK